MTDNDPPETARDSPPRPSFPMFKEGTNTELAYWADLLKYDVDYIKAVREGHKTIGPNTQRVWAALTGKSIAEMFGEEDA